MLDIRNKDYINVKVDTQVITEGSFEAMCVVCWIDSLYVLLSRALLVKMSDT